MRDQNILGNIIKKNRVRYGIPRRVVADKLGYSSAQVIYMIESGRMRMPYDKLLKMSKLLMIDRKLVAKVLLDEFIYDLEKTLNIKVS